MAPLARHCLVATHAGLRLHCVDCTHVAVPELDGNCVGERPSRHYLRGMDHVLGVLPPKRVGVRRCAAGAACLTTPCTCCRRNFRRGLSITVSTLLMLYIAWAELGEFRRRIGPAAKSWLASLSSEWMLFATLIVWGVLMVPLYLTRFFPEDEQGNVYSGGSCWADMPIHMHFANSFIYGRNQDVAWGTMHSPIFAGEVMTYPFIPDWHAGVLYWMGDGMRHAMMWPGMFMFFSCMGLLYTFNRRLARSDIAAALSTAMVVFAGGQGGINLYHKFGFEQVMQEYDPIQDDVGDKGNVFWFAFMPHVYLPQRGATFAYPMVLAAFLMVWAVTSRVNPVSPAARRTGILLAAMCCGTLPMVQAHSFLGAGLVILVVFLLDALWWLRSPSVLWAWLVGGIAAVAMGVPQMSQFLNMVTTGNGPSGKGSFMEFRPIWKPPGFNYPADVTHFFWFWWRALGPCIPLAFAAVAWVWIPAAQGYLAAARAMLAHATSPTAAPKTAPTPPAAAAAPSSPARAKDSDEEEGAAPGKLFGASDLPPFGGTGKPLRRQAPTYSGDRTHPLGYLFGGGVQEPLEPEELTAYIKSVTDSYAPLSAMAAAGDAALQKWNGSRDVDAAKWVAGGLFVWAFGNYVMLQPWDRDNCKILYIALFILCGAGADLLAYPLTAAARALRGLPQPEAAPRKAKEDDAPKPGQRGETAFSGEKLPLRGMGGWTWKIAAPGVVAVPLALAALAGMVFYAYYGAFSGALSVAREHRLYHVLYDQDFKNMGEWIRRHVPPKSVMVHHDTHITPVGLYAGHPSLISYNGWMWSHGYDYYERDRDRRTILDHMLKDSDQNCVNLMRRWGVRYVLGENAYHWPRQTDAADFDEDVYLDGNLKRVFKSGRFELFEVLGYGFPPG